MKSRRITEISLQSDEIFTLRQSAGFTRTLCPQCDSASAMLTSEEAHTLFGMSVRALCREVEAGRLHFQEDATGTLLICLHSLQSSALPGSGNSTLQIDQSQTNQIQISKIKENPS